MTPLPPPLGTGELYLWRLNEGLHAAEWNSGEGSYKFGGRWSPVGIRVVYASLDPATAILEVAVHKTFRMLDTSPHILTWARIVDLKHALVVKSSSLPNPNWLGPGEPSAGQQVLGASLVEAHTFVLLPSVVSSRSWNVIFDPAKAKGLYDKVGHEPFALDTRLHPPRSV